MQASNFHNKVVERRMGCGQPGKVYIAKGCDNSSRIVDNVFHHVTNGMIQGD